MRCEELEGALLLFKELKRVVKLYQELSGGIKVTVEYNQKDVTMRDIESEVEFKPHTSEEFKHFLELYAETLVSKLQAKSLVIPEEYLL